MTRRTLLDLNVLIALTDKDHPHHEKAWRWFRISGKEGWGICPLTESGFMRVMINPTMPSGPRSLEEALAVLKEVETQPGYQFWPMTDSWVSLTAPFASRIFGHQQVTDAYLLGLAVKEKGVLVTFDKGLVYLAGAEYRQHVLLLE